MNAYYALASDIASVNLREAFALLPHSRYEKALRDRGAGFAKIWSRKEAWLKMLGTDIVDSLQTVDTTTLNISTREAGRRMLSVCGERLESLTELTIGESDI